MKSIVFILSLSIIACGSGPNFGNLMPIPATPSDLNSIYTGGTDIDGRPYTAFSPEEEVAPLKENVSDSKENKAFASQLLSAKAKMDGMKLSVVVHWENIKDPLEFSGELINKNGFYAAELTETTNQRPDLILNATCNDTFCSYIRAYIQDSSGHKAALVIRQEKRILKLKLPEEQKENVNLLSQDLKKIVTEAQKGEEVTVMSTEVYPGKAQFEISGKNGSIQGDLLDTSGGGLLINTTGDYSKVGSMTMNGNTTDGELMFKSTIKLESKSSTPLLQPKEPTAKELADAEKPYIGYRTGIRKKITSPSPPSTVKVDDSPSIKVPEIIDTQVNGYWFLEPRNATLVTVEEPPKKKEMPPNVEPSASLSESKTFPVETTQASMHPLVKQILNESENKYVTDFIKKNFLILKYIDNKGAEKTQMGALSQDLNKYFDCRNGDQKSCGASKVLVTDRLISLLRKTEFPAAWSVLAYFESNFDPSAVGSRGERGVWQLMPDTGREMGLTQASERADIDKSTIAATGYFKKLLGYWNNNLNMALASYNSGYGAVFKKCNTVGDDESCDYLKNSRKNSLRNLREEFEVTQYDFWKFYKYNTSTLPATTKAYVLKFLGANIVSKDPQKYGYNQKPVDLN